MLTHRVGKKKFSKNSKITIEGGNMKKACVTGIRSGSWWPCVWRGSWRLMTLEVFSNPSHSMILGPLPLTMIPKGIHGHEMPSRVLVS